MLFIELLQCQQKKHYDIGLMIDFVKKKIFTFYKKIKNKGIKIESDGKMQFFLHSTIHSTSSRKKLHCNFYFDQIYIFLLRRIIEREKNY